MTSVGIGGTGAGGIYARHFALLIGTGGVAAWITRMVRD